MNETKVQLGDCFVRSFRLQQYSDGKGARVQFIGDPILVHGIVWHKVTGYHVHGWVEDDIFCYDFVDNELVRVVKPFYYRVGRIKTGEDEIKRYTEDEAADACYKKKNYYFSNLPIDK